MGDITDQNFVRIAHLLRRAGFGASRDEVESYAKLGMDGAIARLVHYDTEMAADSFEQVQDRLQSDFLDFNNFGDLQLWWLQKMINTKHPLQEKMTLFWHGHFASAYSKVRSPEMLFRQNQTFRRMAVGSFRDITLAISRDPAMIIYLDNQTNRRGHANENYARELFELFTLGIGNYTEQDIHEAARAFTGWSTNRIVNRFVFNRMQHDTGDKTVFGKTGPWNGDDIVEMATARPESARFICTKLFKFFVFDNPTPADVAPFVQVYRDSNLEIRPVLEAMFRSPVFYSDRAMWAKIKSPAEFVVGALRTTRAEAPARLTPQAMRAMGQELFNPPNVKGWDGGTTWVNTTTLLSRFNFAMQLARLNEENQPMLEEIRTQLDARRLDSPEEMVDYFSRQILHREPSTHTRTTLVRYLNSRAARPGAPANSPQEAMLKVHGLLHMIMLTPEYQLA
jgi:uncharacterized protein (DUF1800 family)